MFKAFRRTRPLAPTSELIREAFRFPIDSPVLIGAVPEFIRRVTALPLQARRDIKGCASLNAVTDTAIRSRHEFSERRDLLVSIGKIAYRRIARNARIARDRERFCESVSREVYALFNGE